MQKPPQWAFPESRQPKAAETRFDLARALDAMVLVRAEIPSDGFTAGILGTERGGYGVVIGDDGLVLTIGYLITEASQIWLTTNRGAVVAGYPLAYDQATGFGLIQPLGKLDAPPVPLGLSSGVKVGDPVFVLGHGGRAHALKTRVTAKHEFAGYWEYLLDEALFTSPAHPQWGGAALMDAQGALIGIGSLLMEQAGEEDEGDPIQVNMFVPIDLLRPILDSLLTTGASQHPPRPWLGIYVQEQAGRLVVGDIASGGPSERAGVLAGDIVLNVGPQRVLGLPELYRAVWRLGAAGVGVPLTLARSGTALELFVKSTDRNSLMKKPNLQ